jgi:hypothetical protein
MPGGGTVTRVVTIWREFHEFVIANFGSRMCVCLLLQYLVQICSRGGRGIVEDMCYTRDDEARPWWTSLVLWSARIHLACQ